MAWVSGMCHPEYSCTINEGNNFESVYVIAHEMGHKYDDFEIVFWNCLIFTFNFF